MKSLQTIITALILVFICLLNFFVFENITVAVLITVVVFACGEVFSAKLNRK
jgi:hypothetical protein